MILQTFWLAWKQGWVVVGRLLWFYFVLSFMLLPLAAVGAILAWINPDFRNQEQAVIINGYMNWLGLVYLILCFVWLPFACRLAAEFTAEFKTDDAEKGKSVESSLAS